MLAKLGDIWNGAEGFYVKVNDINEARERADLYGFILLRVDDEDIEVEE